MINSSLDAFNKVVQAVERKKGKLQELLLTEESYLENLEAVERILLEAKNSRKDDSMPKQLRYITRNGHIFDLYKYLSSREREFIMFGNVERIILFHRMVFTAGLREADGQAEKVKAY